MKLCKRTIDFVQITNADGAVRLCSWLNDGGIIGHLSENSLEEIYNSNEANLIRKMHAVGDHSNCNINTCPYVANGNFDECEIEFENVPKYPRTLYLAFENVCNYHCVMCGIPGCVDGIDAKTREEKYNKIDAEIRKALPYIKHISANGLGELFVSKHTLKLLSEWKPIADPSEISASLETNGSLFDEEHWKQISNLGQYHLSVSITVLSFENDIYQELSGTKHSVDRLIENLKFVKSLREKGEINFLEIATVYQDKNYKQLPDFARRCIEEFGADSVRLRPFEPWGEVGMKEWMMDVRNIYHPNHSDFLEVMKDPYLKHPKVHDWGGGRESGLGPEPYKKTRKFYSIIEYVFTEKFIKELNEIVGERKVVVYGMTTVGKALVSRIKDDLNIAYCLDRDAGGTSFMDIPIYGLNCFDELDKDVVVIIALNWIEDTIRKMLIGAGYHGEIFGITELIKE